MSKSRSRSCSRSHPRIAAGDPQAGELPQVELSCGVCRRTPAETAFPVSKYEVMGEDGHMEEQELPE